MKLPAGAITISGQSGQSLKLCPDPGTMHGFGPIATETERPSPQLSATGGTGGLSVAMRGHQPVVKRALPAVLRAKSLKQGNIGGRLEIVPNLGGLQPRCYRFRSPALAAGSTK